MFDWGLGCGEGWWLGLGFLGGGGVESEGGVCWDGLLGGGGGRG